MPTSPLSTGEFNRLETACRNLATSSVQDEEAEAARSPMLILMSTVLSLNRRWYSHALPARRHFEQGPLHPSFIRHEDIALRAFQISKSRERASPEGNWLRAENELLASK